MLVLGPTRELAQQVFGVAKQVSHFSRARVGLAAGGVGVPTQAKQLDRPLDVVVGTPGRVWEHVRNSSLFLGDVQCVILDEADTMFDRGFGEDVRRLLGPLRGPAIDAQAVLATATVTAPVQRLLESALEGLVPVKTSTLHKSALNAEHDFLDVTGQDKLHALAGVLRASGSTHQVVFCNTLGSCRAAEHYLANAAAATAQCVAAHRVAMGGAGDAEARILRHLRSLAGWWARQAVTFDACVCITCTPRGVKRVGGGYDIYDWGQAAWVRAQAHLALRQLCADSPPRPGSAASAAGALAWHDLSRSAVGRRARAAAADASPSAEDAKDDASGANEWPVDQPGGAPVEGDGAALAADNQGPGDTDEFEESAGPADDPGDDAANDAFEEFMERRAG